MALVRVGTRAEVKSARMWLLTGFYELKAFVFEFLENLRVKLKHGQRKVYFSGVLFISAVLSLRV
jgi:hypothetical protein